MCLMDAPMAAAADHTRIARQPILDARNQVYGYELLFRATARRRRSWSPATPRPGSLLTR